MRKLSALLIGFGLVILVVSGLNSTANAAGVTYDPLSQVEHAGVLDAGSTLPPGAQIKTAPTAGVPSQASSPSAVADLNLTAQTRATSNKRSSYGGVPVTVNQGASYGVVIGKNTVGNTAGFISIGGPSAPSQYSFTVAPQSGGQITLALQSDGSILVTNSAGQFVNLIQTPWAVDASGKYLPTSYAISGNTITQTVRLTGAAYPVLADPSFSCGFLNCTVQFNKSETRSIAAGGLIGAGALIAVCNKGGPALAAVCAVNSVYIIGVAALANSQRGCLEVHAAGVVPLVTWWAWSYSGGYCR